MEWRHQMHCQHPRRAVLYSVLPRLPKPSAYITTTISQAGQECPQGIKILAWQTDRGGSFSGIVVLEGRLLLPPLCLTPCS
jgi:hypothetical protein